MDKISFLLLNLVFNSFLTFFTAALLVEVILWIFRIQEGRASSFLRMIPILKLPLDLFLYDFSRWSYLQGVNPFDCKEGSRTLSLLVGWTDPWFDRFFPIHSEIQLTTIEDQTFTLADLIGYKMDLHHLHLFSLFFLLISLFFFIKKGTIYYQSFKKLRLIENNSEFLTKKIKNHYLASKIEKKRYSIRTSLAIQGSPFVAGFLSPSIYIPSNLSQALSRKEYEAILAHELEHLRNQDVWVRFILDVIRSIFWWIPTKWLQNKIEEDQEISCDCRSQKYGIYSVDLASAIYKSAKIAKTTDSTSFFSHFLKKKKSLKRVKKLIEPSSIQSPKIGFLLSFLAIFIGLSIILFGRFWIF